MRVNLINPDLLCDQHLMAEYRESFMLPGSMRLWLKKQSVSDIRKKIPAKFPLGGGHILFFADKGKYMSDRYQILIAELNARGYKLNGDRQAYPLEVHPIEFQNDYIPDDDAYDLIHDRIRSRILLKPEWYRYKGVKFTDLAPSLQNKLLFLE
jgi:deoxyribonuclease (pyrimidine dimer)